MTLVILITIALLLFSEVYYGFLFSPVGLYSLMWGLLSCVAISFSADGAVSDSVLHMFAVSWIAFLVGAAATTFFIGRVRLKNKALIVFDVDMEKVRKLGIVTAWAGLIFSILYYVKSRQVLGAYLSGQELRHLWYSRAGELSAAGVITSWYGYNLGMATIMLSFFLNTTCIAVIGGARRLSVLLGLFPSALAIIVLSYAEVSRARIIDAIIIIVFVYLFLKAVRIDIKALILFIRKEYPLLIVTFGFLSVASLITSDRNIGTLSERHVINVFENVAKYFEVSVLSVNTFLGAVYQEQIGMRAVIHPIYFLLERVHVLPVGPIPDPTILTQYVTYPTPTYLFWIYSSYGWPAIVFIPFLFGAITTAIYLLQRVRKTIFLTWALVCCYMTITLTYGGWRLSQLWFVLLLMLLVIAYRYSSKAI